MRRLGFGLREAQQQKQGVRRQQMRVVHQHHGYEQRPAGGRKEDVEPRHAAFDIVALGEVEIELGAEPLDERFGVAHGVGIDLGDPPVLRSRCVQMMKQRGLAAALVAHDQHDLAAEIDQMTYEIDALRQRGGEQIALAFRLRGFGGGPWQRIGSKVLGMCVHCANIRLQLPDQVNTPGVNIRPYSAIA
ncbi:MAG: hypothetical protein HONDAALG_00421 [Gammaproteobacteria bacterium]|nr:hypothetical protein [Gammaproteobacteria bacterium]